VGEPNRQHTRWQAGCSVSDAIRQLLASSRSTLLSAFLVPVTRGIGKTGRAQYQQLLARYAVGHCAVCNEVQDVVCVQGRCVLLALRSVHSPTGSHGPAHYANVVALTLLFAPACWVFTVQRPLLLSCWS
jgi:hypothetical protein